MKDEDTLPYNGPLSTYPEWHSLQHGVYDGMRDVTVRPGELPDDPDVQAEPHYFKSGYVIGTIFQLLVMLALFLLGDMAL